MTRKTKNKTEVFTLSSDTVKRYKETLSFISGFSNTSYRKNYGAIKKDSSFFLERTRSFLDLVGNPVENLNYIHITGTAGKGTVSNMVHEILTSAHKRSGLFTSPYTTTAIEEIRVEDTYISPADLIRIVDNFRPHIKKAESGKFGAPSSFEILLAVALTYFHEQKCEYVVLEVGLGGRYDATNVISNPKITAITNIDYDHTEILGKTLKEIAYDKAGIIKPNCSFFTSENRPSLIKFFKSICAEKKASLYQIERRSDYQDRNRLLARKITENLGIEEQFILEGFDKTKLPCRFEIIKEKPLIILDGAHNRAKIRSTISNIKKLTYQHLTVIVAISDTKKDNRAILEPIMSVADSVILTSITGTERRSVHPNALLPYTKRHKRKNTKIEIILDPHEALTYARKNTKPSDCILVTGSFFLAGELRTEWFPENWILKHQKSF